MQKKQQIESSKIEEGRIEELKDTIQMVNLSLHNVKTEIKVYLYNFSDSCVSSDDEENIRLYLESTVMALSNFSAQLKDGSIILNIPTQWNREAIHTIALYITFNDKNLLTDGIYLLKNLKYKLMNVETILENNEAIKIAYQTLDLFANLLCE